MDSPAALMAKLGWIAWFLTVIGWFLSPIISLLVNKLFVYLWFDASRKLRELQTRTIPELQQTLGVVVAQRVLGAGDLKIEEDLKSALFEAEDILDLLDYRRIEKGLHLGKVQLRRAIHHRSAALLPVSGPTPQPPPLQFVPAELVDEEEIVEVTRVEEAEAEEIQDGEEGAMLEEIEEESCEQVGETSEEEIQEDDEEEKEGEPTSLSILRYCARSMLTWFAKACFYRDRSYGIVGIKSDKKDGSAAELVPITERLSLRNRIKRIEDILTDSKKSLLERHTGSQPKGQDIDSSFLSMVSQQPSKAKADAIERDRYESEQQRGRARTVDGKTMVTTMSAMQSDRDEWVLDTRASSHRTSNPRLLLGGSDHEETDMDTPATSVDDPPLNIRHGLVRTKRFEIPDVSYVEGEARNVISVSQLASRHGLVTIFEPTRCYLKDKKTGQTVGQGHLRDDGVYVLDNLRIRQDKGGRTHNEYKGEGKVSDSDIGGRPSGGTSNTGDDKKGQARGEESGNHSGRCTDSGRDGEGDRDGDGDQGGDKGGEEEKAGDEGLINHPPYTSFCPCGKNALLILSGACEQCGLQPPKASQECIYVVPVHDGSTPRPMDFIMDSGAGSHMTWNGDTGFLEKYGPMFRTPISSVSGIDGSSLPVDGWGQVNTGRIRLKNVLHVPRATVNLVSLSKLADEYSARVVFERQCFLIQKLWTKETIGLGRRMYSHYILDSFWPDDSCQGTTQPRGFVGTSHNQEDLSSLSSISPGTESTCLFVRQLSVAYFFLTGVVICL